MAEAIIIIIVGIFASGVVAGGVMIVSLGIHAEERQLRQRQRASLTNPEQDVRTPEEPPSEFAGGARAIAGLHVSRYRMPEPEQSPHLVG